jgi:beta-phosphoglucomutase-like phosphatase (HAD superfamily)
VTGVRAVIFDFNGTISDDEPVLDRLFRAMSADLGTSISSDDYYRDLAGFSDHEIVDRILRLNGIEPSAGRRDELLRDKVARYKRIVVDDPTISATAGEFVRAVAARVPVAIASGALREEVEHVLAIAGLADAFHAIVCIDDVERGKPDPEGFQVALAVLNRATAAQPPIEPSQVLVFEDADAGVQAAKAAGMRCAALVNPAYTGDPVAADLVLERLSPGLVDGLLA